METYFETVIEISYFSYFFYVSIVVFFLASYKRVKPIYDSKVLKIINVKYNFVLVLVILYSLINICVQYQVLELKKDLVNKNVETVQGAVKGYTSEKFASREESFIVNNVKFVYNDVATPDYFFANRKRGDGVILNGRVVKISYFDDGKSRNIVKVEVEK